MKRLGYTKSLALVFGTPFAVLFPDMLQAVSPAPFLIAVAEVCLLGWAWSMTLSQKKWWVFSENDIVGLRVLPHLPLEEFAIYPLGGAFSIYCYRLGCRLLPAGTGPGWFWVLLLAVALVFGTLAAASPRQPYYLYSQLVLYNGLCLLLAPLTAARVQMGGLLVSVAILGTTGFVWDFFAFKFGWWRYRAVTGLRLARIPIEDANFYVMGPTAAISLYIVLCHSFAARVPLPPT